MKTQFSSLILALFLGLISSGCGSYNDPKDGTDDGTDKNGTFKDSRDQRTYKYVKIGTQIWMAENLAYLPAVSPSSDGSETSAYYYVYDYEGSNVSDAKSNGNYTSYGVLYSWVAAKAACPSGWHLPTHAEWTTLEDYLGEPAGKKMKSVTGWSDNGNGDNSSGFTALPAGYRGFNGGVNYLGHCTYLWTSTEKEDLAWYRILYDYDNTLFTTNSYRSCGFSVRCVKN